MRLTIVHLSDIHLRGVNDPVLARANKLIAAVSGLTPKPEAVLISVSGDVAHSGKAEEYHIALEFLRSLENQFKELNRDVELAFAVVPGNHDCYLPEPIARLRHLLVEGVLSQIDLNQPDREILTQLLNAQTSYFDFQGSATSSQVASLDERLCSSKVIRLQGTRIQVNLYNTALLSERDERQGSLRVPNAIINQQINLDSESMLSIALLHHTYPWLESNNGIEFRRHIDENSDLVLVGHQHVDNTYVKENLALSRNS